jgi:hypothetical protein
MISIRFVHLDADTPLALNAGIGAYVDEGYKTLDPRNLFLYGKTHWNPSDDYKGWTGQSPVTQWSYYMGFKFLGNNIKSVRSVTIFYFCIFLLGFAFSHFNRYSYPLLVSSIFILGVENLLFFYSRIALFEIPITAILYLTMFLLLSWDERKKTLHVIIAVLLTAIITVFTVKKSAVIYFLPVILAAFTEHYSANPVRFKWNKIFLFLGMLGAIVIGIIGYFTSDVWLSRIWINPSEFSSRIVGYKLVHGSPFVVILGLLVTAHGLITRNSDFVKGFYRKGLIFIILLGPLLIALFRAPLRFYIPFVPAYILITLEWINLKVWEVPINDTMNKSSTLLGFLLVFLVAMYTGIAINDFVLSHITIGDDPGLTMPRVFQFFTPVAFVAALFIWRYRKFYFSRKIIFITVAVYSFFFLVHSASLLGTFLYKPVFDGKNIRASISKLAPEGKSVAGDWAPELTLGTQVRTLYTDRHYNKPSRILEIIPDYFLYSGTPESDTWLEQLSKIPQVNLGKPILESQYVGKKVLLYPIIYTD